MMGALILVILGLATITVLVQLEADYVLENLGGGGSGRALVLFHPSRDARFSDQISEALAEGFKDAGLTVDRTTLTRTTPGAPEGYAIIGIVSNTYYWAPDRPTRRYLDRANLSGLPSLAIIGGAGSTGRAERMLGQALRDAGATVLGTRSVWLWRPNDESRMDEPNRGLALEIARQLGRESAARVLSGDVSNPDN